MDESAGFLPACHVNGKIGEKAVLMEIQLEWNTKIKAQTQDATVNAILRPFYVHVWSYTAMLHAVFLH